MVAFQCKKPGFGFYPARSRVTPQAAVSADNPMTGNDDGNWIPSKRSTNRPGIVGITQQSRNLSICIDCTKWNIAGHFKHSFLKWLENCPINWYVKLVPVPVEIVQ